MSSESSERLPERGDVFATTHWSVVLAAGSGSGDRAHAALQILCETYWYPLYEFVRRKGFSPEDAEELTQGFLVRLLQTGVFSQLDPAQGRFRAFLLASLKNFLANEWDRRHAKKRGGGQIPISIDQARAEERFRLEPVSNESPDILFERRWAQTLLDRVVQCLAEEFSRMGQGRLFEALKGTLAGEGRTGSYAALGSGLGMSEAAVKTAVHRMRKRYRGLLRAEIARTVASADEVEEEIQYLFRVFS